MDMLQENKKTDKWSKWIDRLLKVEIILFIIIIVIAIAYYNYDSAHPYFNTYISDMEIPWYSFEALASTIATDIFLVSYFSTFFFPFIFLAQIILIFWKSTFSKKRIMKSVIIFVFYFLCVIAALSFYLINNGNNFKKNQEYRLKQVQENSQQQAE